MNAVVQYLQAVLEGFGPSGENWIQGAYAVDPQGDVCDLSAGCKWCLLGAVIRERRRLRAQGVSFDRADSVYLGASHALEQALGDNLRMDLVRYNDAPARKFADIEALLCQAIEIAERMEVSVA